MLQVRQFSSSRSNNGYLNRNSLAYIGKHLLVYDSQSHMPSLWRAGNAFFFFLKMQLILVFEQEANHHPVLVFRLQKSP